MVFLHFRCHPTEQHQASIGIENLLPFPHDDSVHTITVPMVSSRKDDKAIIPTRKRKKPGLPSQPRTKRPKKKSFNTCEVAKGKTVTELIGANHGGNASVKLTALQGLCLISEEYKWSITCPACNKAIRTKKLVNYDFCEPVSQVGTDGQYIVRLFRQHCRAMHPDTWVWNAVPPIRIRGGDGITAFEHFLHQALKAGGLYGYIPKYLTPNEFISAFCMRIANSLSWIRWSRMMNKRLNKLQRIEALREDATDRINRLLDNGMARIMSSDFAKVLERHTLYQACNKLMLFFCEMGRYKHCPIFGLEDN